MSLNAEERTQLLSAGPSSDLASAWRAWERFWFLPADPIVLGFIRVCAGALVVYVHLAYTFGLMDYVGPHAWVDDEAMNYLRYQLPIFGPASSLDWTGDNVQIATGHTIWSIYYSVNDPFWAHAVHFAILLAMVLFTLGLWTRVTSVLTWVGAMCYLQRAPTTLFGMDTMMNILLIYLMIGPSGAALSLDRWLAIRRQGFTLVNAPSARPLVSANFAIRCLQLHFCVIYMASGASKLLGSAWWSGTALWGTVANYSFAPMYLDWYMNALLWLSKHRLLWELAMTSGAVFTLVLEIGFPFLVWLPRWRWLMICSAVVLHTGIGLTMGLVTFSLMMICICFSFVPPEAVHYLIDSVRGVAPPLPRTTPVPALAAKA